MPTIEISEQTFKRLQELARPLVDTPDSVIERLLILRPSSDKPQPLETRNGGGSEFDPATPPDLTFAKLRSARFGEKNVERPNWAELVRTALGVGLSHLGFEELRASSDANIVKGPKTGEGYNYIAHLGISLQGEDAQDCWRIAFRLARKLSLPIAVVFEWRDKDGAAYPGRVGTMTWTTQE